MTTMSNNESNSNLRIPPKGFHVDLGKLNVETSSLEDLENDNSEMDTVDDDNIDWGAIHSSQLKLIQESEDDEDDYDDDEDDDEDEEDEDEEDDDDYDVDDYDVDESSEDPGEQYVDRDRERWNDLLSHENEPDFFLKLCELWQNYMNAETSLSREMHNKIDCYTIRPTDSKHFQETVRTLVENYLLFGFSCFSNKPYSQAITHDNYWRLLKDAREILKMKPSLLDSETEQMLINLLAEKEKSGLWYKIKKLLGMV